MPQEPDLYTAYVRSLDKGKDSLTMETYNEVCQVLAKDLANEIGRRGLLDASPTYFGVVSNKWGKDELDELAQEAYDAIFISRLRGLRNQAKTKDNVRGLVIRNIKNFLTERQMKADPIGYRVFDRLRRAVMLAIERGELRCANQGTDGTPRLSNDSILAFGEATEPLASAELLGEHAVRWNNELFPKWIVALGKTVPLVADRLAELIVTLEDADVQSFSFGDLVDAVKKDVRWRHDREVFPNPDEYGFEGDDAKVMRVPIVDPRRTPGDGDFIALVDCVRHTIDGLDDKPRTKRELFTLFTLMRDHSEGDEEKRLSNVKLGKLLGISRERVSKLLIRLGGFVRRCLQGREGGAQ